MDFTQIIRDVPVSVGVIILLVLSLRVTDRIMERRAGVTQFTRQLTMIAMTGMAMLVALLALPNSIVSDAQVVRLAGLLGGVLVTLSSTTLLANAMAGLMMRNVKSFRLGDFVEVDGYIGRVSQRGLFHVEIQTAQSDLVTLPNQFLITRPLRVIRASGTFITGDISLGYDAAHQVVEPLLIDAAERAGLTECFVQVLELGDYTVTYQVSGFLSDVRTLFTAQSSLRRRVLDSLHEGGIEIASPMLLGHRSLPTEKLVIPEWNPTLLEHDEDDESAAPAALIFDKAEEAMAEDRAMSVLENKKAAFEALEAKLKKAPDDERHEIVTQMEALDAEIKVLAAELEAHRIDDAVDAEAGEET